MKAFIRKSLWAWLFCILALPATAQIGIQIGTGTSVPAEQTSVIVADVAFVRIDAEGFVYYTLDGTEPTTSSTAYQPFSLGLGTHELRIVAYSNDLSQETRRQLVVEVRPSLTIHIGTEVPFAGSAPYTVLSDPPPQYGNYVSNSVVTITARPEYKWLAVQGMARGNRFH